MFGLFPKKGTIAVGSDTDIVIFDAEKEHTFGVANEHMNVDYSSYEDWTVKAKSKRFYHAGASVLKTANIKERQATGSF